jgi:hypothetical protein
VPHATSDAWYCPPESPVHADPHQATAMWCHPYSFKPAQAPRADWYKFCPANLNITGPPAHPMWVLGGTEDSFGMGTGALNGTKAPGPPPRAAKCAKGPDVVVVGGGLSGLTAAIFLSNAGLSVAVLEKEPAFGGLASFLLSPRSGRPVARGAAYWPDSNMEERAILETIGLGTFLNWSDIHEPVDSYLHNGTLYEDVWRPETLGQLPACFAVFKKVLLWLEDHDYVSSAPAASVLRRHRLCTGPALHCIPHLRRCRSRGCADDARSPRRTRALSQVPDQPMEEHEDNDLEPNFLDTMMSDEWIRRMPRWLEDHIKAFPNDREARVLLRRLYADILEGRVDALNPMQPVIDFLDLYCHSALGGNTAQVSATLLANFYTTELVNRYTTGLGTGEVAERMAQILQSRRGSGVTMRTRAMVTLVEHLDVDTTVDSGLESSSAVATHYMDADGAMHCLRSKFVVYAAPLVTASHVIPGMKKERKKQTKLFDDLVYTNYGVSPRVHVRARQRAPMQPDARHTRSARAPRVLLTICSLLSAPRRRCTTCL